MPWLFTYGSLMWRPGFDHDDRVTGTVHGFHRAFTVPSTVRWGSPDHPAPTLGLEPGGTCTGIAYRVDKKWEETMDYVREREGEGFSFPAVVVDLADGRTVEAVIAVPDRDTATLRDRSVQERVDLAVAAQGDAGTTGTEYVLETHRQVVDCDIHDPHVDELAAAVRARLEQENG